jgi:hypothetical protein
MVGRSCPTQAVPACDEPEPASAGQGETSAYGATWLSLVDNPVVCCRAREHPTVQELESSLSCIESGVTLMACQMTVDLFGWNKDDFIPEVSEWAGAATFLTVARESDICLYT